MERQEGDGEIEGRFELRTKESLANDGTNDPQQKIKSSPCFWSSQDAYGHRESRGRPHEEIDWLVNY